ncbi:MAG: hypothetical protein L0Z62_13625 [Gemmataceae bacterium]|nr:hypothetical protein [Gemmataceae bacterium]
MKKLALASLAVVVLGLLAEESQAFGRRRQSHGGDCAPAYAPSCAPAPAMTVVWVDREITAYKPVYKPYQVKETVYRMHTIPEKVPYKYSTWVPKWDKKPQTITVCTLKPHVVERDVVSCQYVPVTCCDPCTGCCRTICVPQTVCHKVKVTVYQPHYDKKEIMVDVCTYQEKVHEGTYERVRCEWKPHVVERTYHRCEYEPYKTTIRVPVCVPVMPPPCPPVMAAAAPHH